MAMITQIDEAFIEEHTIFIELIQTLKLGFSSRKALVPLRHHHDFPNPAANLDSTLLLMPAWSPNEYAGVKIVTVNPENNKFNLPTIQGTYIYLDATTGTIKAILEAKSLTAKRTAAASALASSYLSRTDSNSILMIGTGTLAINLIKAHASVRPIKFVYVWGRNFEKAQEIASKLRNEDFVVQPIMSIEEKIGDVDIVSCATLSPIPLVLGKYLKQGQHIDLVGAYKKDMREADDDTILKSSVFVDTFQGGLKESGDIVIPLENKVITKDHIKADLFDLTSSVHPGRKNENEITLFKSVGHALEDLVAATYYYNKYTNE